MIFEPTQYGVMSPAEHEYAALFGYIRIEAIRPNVESLAFIFCTRFKRTMNWRTEMNKIHYTAAMQYEELDKVVSTLRCALKTYSVLNRARPVNDEEREELLYYVIRYLKPSTNHTKHIPIIDDESLSWYDLKAKSLPKIKQVIAENLTTVTLLARELLKTIKDSGELENTTSHFKRKSMEVVKSVKSALSLFDDQYTARYFKK